MARVKLLFVCSMNQWRSPTAEALFANSARYEARSAGTEKGARVKITEGHIGWADWIFAMEKKHVRRIRENFPEALAEKRLVCLNIPDNYLFMDEELVALLKSSLSLHLPPGN